MEKTLCFRLAFQRQCKVFQYLLQKNPIDTGRKLNVNKTFRRRPRRLLNVLCTFNLSPLLRGRSTASRILKKSYWCRSYNCINSAPDFCILRTCLLIDIKRNELISNRSVSSSAFCTGIAAEFAILIYANLTELIDFYSALGFLMISPGIEVS